MSAINKHILLVEDDLEDRLSFVRALESLDQTILVESAENGVVAMDLLLDAKRELPYLIFLDLKLPLFSGNECLVQIRSNARLKHLMVIIYSASFDIKMVDQLYESGADYYLRKPQDFFAFKNTLRTAINLATANNYRTRNDFVINPFR